jgi:hypothetical protein
MMAVWGAKIPNKNSVAMPTSTSIHQAIGIILKALPPPGRRAALPATLMSGQKWLARLAPFVPQQSEPAASIGCSSRKSSSVTTSSSIAAPHWTNWASGYWTLSNNRTPQ